VVGREEPRAWLAVKHDKGGFDVHPKFNIVGAGHKRLVPTNNVRKSDTARPAGLDALPVSVGRTTELHRRHNIFALTRTKILRSNRS
jgi:hypothetical protein